MICFFAGALLAVALFIAPALRPLATAASAATSTPQVFDTEAAAQAHCLRDTVVWLNIPTGIYHEKGMR